MTNAFSQYTKVNESSNVSEPVEEVMDSKTVQEEEAEMDELEAMLLKLQNGEIDVSAVDEWM